MYVLPFFIVSVNRVFGANEMKKKVMGASLGIVILVFLFIKILAGQGVNTKTTYIFDKKNGIGIAEVKKLRKKLPVNPTETGESTTPSLIDFADVYPDNIANTDTLRLFKHLQMMFKDSTDIDDHLSKIRDYLASQFPADEAAALFEFYSRYLHCEIDMMDARKHWDIPGGTHGMIETLRKAQEFRRERLGTEVADALFGVEIKAKEYALRRAAIVNDTSLYGVEKESILADLNDDMWGEDADQVDSIATPYNSYREKIKMYQKELSELGSDEEKSAMIRTFRQEIFSPDAVERLEEVDTTIAREKETEKEYMRSEQEILADPTLGEVEKKQAIEDLQHEFFGDQGAEAYQRRETMQNELEKREARRKAQVQ